MSKLKTIMIQNTICKILVGVLVIMFTSCSSNEIRSIIDADSPEKKTSNLLKYKGFYYAKNPEQLRKDINALQKKVKKFRKNIDSVWGKKDKMEPGPKDYVKYTDKYYNRAHINFETGNVTVETVAPDSQRNYLKKAIISTLLTPDDPRQVDLYSDKTPVADSKNRPFLYEQVLDQNGKAIAWKWRANRYAEYLIKNRLQQFKLSKKRGLRVTFPLVAKHQQLRAYKYADLVGKYSNKYNVTESLVYGVIKTESSLNPFAVSRAPAYGLMQIVPGTAGRDVFEKIKQRSDQPTPEYLYDPENNIDTGTAYLKILQERYLSKINDNNSRRYSVISAYNGGAGNVFKTFSSNRDEAVIKLNRLSAKQVYEKLHTQHPSRESRHYLYKVTEAQKEFWRNEGFRK